VINFLVQRFGERIEDEDVEDEDIFEEDEIVEDFEGLQDDNGYFFVECLVLITPKMHSGLAGMLGTYGSMVDV
jgi:hypothetical protein